MRKRPFDAILSLDSYLSTRRNTLCFPSLANTIMSTAIIDTPNAILDEVLGLPTEITGSGVEALIALFQALVQRIQHRGGLKVLMEMSTTELFTFFSNFSSENAEVPRVIGELYFTRDPLFDIEGHVTEFENSIKESWVNCEPGTMFALRFLKDLQNLVPRYYLVCASAEESYPRDVMEAWLIDLSHGVHTTCRGIIEAWLIDCDEADEAMAQFIMDRNLQETLATVPRAMLLRARLLGVSNLVQSRTA